MTMLALDKLTSQKKKWYISFVMVCTEKKIDCKKKKL